MAAKKWLNIIVDGSSALGPFWPKIFSDCLEKIVRTFFDDSREEGANNAQCEVGLVMYNANSDLGLDVQYIHWTSDINYFLGILSCLAFNGNDEKQHTMVEGLAKALALFPRPSNVMTTEEYYNGTRHCILIAARDPVPRRMLVSMPEINQGRIFGTQLHTLNVDFCEVAEMFGPLAISLSIISPVQHPIFGVIFNMGNNGSPQATTPISDIRIGQLNVLLSRNFKEAHDALRGKRVDPATKDSVESIKMTNDIRVPIDFANDNQEDLFSVANVVVTTEPIIEAAKDFMLEYVYPLSLVVPNASTSAVVSITPTTSTTGEASLRELDPEEIGNGVVAGSSESFGFGMIDTRGASPADNFMFLHSSGNILNTQPYLLTPILPSVSTSTSSSSRPRLPFQVAGFDQYGRPVFGPSTGVPLAPITPQFNPSDFWPPTPSSRYSQNLVQAWEGTLVGKKHRNRLNTQRGKALRRATSPSTLTSEWSRRLEISFYLPRKTLNYMDFYRTHRLCFLRHMAFQQSRLYEHLTNKNLCGKINISSQTLIISPTKDRHYYIGTIFPADTTFIQNT